MENDDEALLLIYEKIGKMHPWRTNAVFLMAPLLELCNMWVQSALLQNIESLKFYPCSLFAGSNDLLFSSGFK